MESTVSPAKNDPNIENVSNTNILEPEDGLIDSEPSPLLVQDGTNELSKIMSQNLCGSNEGGKDEADFEPNYRGYQLIGDSQFLRFAEQILDMPRKTHNGLSYLGFCVSGQKISDLHRRLKSDFCRLSNKVILMIGTNDLLQYTLSSQMKENVMKLLNDIKKLVNKLIVFTVPPIPLLDKNHEHWYTIKDFNNYLQELSDYHQFVVVDAYKKYIIESRSSSPDPRESRTLSERLREIPASIEVPPQGSNISKKRKRSDDLGTPSKRSRNTSINEDDHDNEKFYEDESKNWIPNADRINENLFEEYYSKTLGRKDLIHLNYRGLCILQNLMDEITDDSEK